MFCRWAEVCVFNGYLLEYIIILQHEFGGLKEPRRKEETKVERQRKVKGSNLRAQKIQWKKRMIFSEVRKSLIKKKKEKEYFVWKKKENCISFSNGERKKNVKENGTKTKKQTLMNYELSNMLHVPWFLLLFWIVFFYCFFVVDVVLFSMYSCGCRGEMTEVSVW